MIKMTPQVQTILSHLEKHGSLSQAEASLIYKIRALPRRIADLKAEGYNIKSELKKDATGQRYARYTLLPKEVVKVKKVITVGSNVRVVKEWIPIDYKVGDEGVVTEVVGIRNKGFEVKFPQLTFSVYCRHDELEAI